MSQPGTQNVVLKELPFPEAAELAELHLIRDDLMHSRHALTLLMTKYADPQDLEQRTIAISLLRDAVVQFAECFGRKRLDAETLYAGIEGGMDFFQWIQDLRDSYAAHQFGPMRQCIVGASWFPDNKGFAIGPMKFLLVSFEAKDIEGIRNLLDVAGRFTDAKIKELEAVVDTKARQIPAETMAALPNARIYGVGPREIRQTRERFRRAKAKAEAAPPKSPPAQPPQD